MTGDVYASEEIEELRALIETKHAIHQESLNHIWVMVATALVMFMQGGFLLLEAGMSRSKNSINAAQKNIIDFLIAIFIFYTVGFSIMFGSTYGGWFGWDSDMSFFNTSEEWHYTFFVFQAFFAGTASTIVSGAVAERMKLSGYIWVTIVIAMFIYPFVGHWGWGNLLNESNTSYLINNGFIDFAGSTIVHSVGAWVALAACIVIGPRYGRYDEKTGRIKRMEGHSLVLSTMGCIIIWVGWIGFNGGSTTVGSPAFAHIIFNTMISSTFGGLAAIFIGRLNGGFFRPDQAINGVLAGLVAITAGCDAVNAWGAAFIGAVAGLLMHYSCITFVKTFRIDDVVGAISVHGVCGVWGTLSLAFFANEAKLGGNTVLQQFSIQLQGVIIVFVWAFGISYIAFKLYHTYIVLRVSKENEIQGLNISEHNATLGIGVLQKRLEDVVDGTHDLTKRINVDHGDESAEIASYINRFIGQMQELMHQIGQEAQILEDHSGKMSEISTLLATRSEAISVQSNEVTKVNKNMASDTDKIAELVGDMGT
ncbi:MAG: ammonium transporter, partial [Rickettsiales bacterium]|nr:ammonium transporter [Rickettsiales bacterium]